MISSAVTIRYSGLNWFMYWLHQIAAALLAPPTSWMMVPGKAMKE